MAAGERWLKIFGESVNAVLFGKGSRNAFRYLFAAIEFRNPAEEPDCPSDLRPKLRKKRRESN